MFTHTWLPDGDWVDRLKAGDWVIRTAAGWPRITPQAEDYFLRHVDSLVPPARKTGRCPIAVWNDHICPDAATAVRELRACAGVQS